MDLTCPVCLSIYFQPIVLPCGHTLCQECLEKSMDMATLGCPICRYRLSAWRRKFKDISLCIDKKLDERIAHLFPQYYSLKKMGLEASLCESELEILHNIAVLEPPQLSIHSHTPGTIKCEFDEAISRFTGKENVEKSIREEADLALSRQMLLEADIEATDLSVDENSSESVCVSVFCCLDPLESTRSGDALRVPPSCNEQHQLESHNPVSLFMETKPNFIMKTKSSTSFSPASMQMSKVDYKITHKLAGEDRVPSRKSRLKKKSTLSCLQNLRRGTSTQSRLRQMSLLGFSSRP